MAHHVNIRMSAFQPLVAVKQTSRRGQLAFKGSEVCWLEGAKVKHSHSSAINCWHLVTLSPCCSLSQRVSARQSSAAAVRIDAVCTVLSEWFGPSRANVLSKLLGNC